MARQKEPDAVLESVAANVYELRNKHGLTQEALAEKVDLTSRYVQEIEGGKATGLTVDVLVRLANALGIDPTELLTPAKLAPPKRGRPRKHRDP